VDCALDQARPAACDLQIDHFGSRRMLHEVPASTMRSPCTRSFAGLQDASVLMSSSPRGAQRRWGCRWRSLGFGGGQEGEQQK